MALPPHICSAYRGILRLFVIALLVTVVGGCSNKQESTRKQEEKTQSAAINARSGAQESGRERKGNSPAIKGLQLPATPSPESFANDPTKLAINVRDGVMHITEGGGIIPERTKKAEVETLLGLPDTSVTDLSPLYDIFDYDKLGIRYATYKRTGTVVYFDIYLSDPGEFGPGATYSGTLVFNGHHVNAQTTKADFEKVAVKVTDFSFGIPGYSVDFLNGTVSVDLQKETGKIKSIRFMH